MHRLFFLICRHLFACTHVSLPSSSFSSSSPPLVLSTSRLTLCCFPLFCARAPRACGYNTSVSTFPTEDADTGDDEETEAFAASPVDLATLKASEGIAARATTFAVANAFVQIDANKAEAEAGSVPFGGAGEAADEAPRADAGDRIDATPPPPPPAQAPTNFAPSPQVKVPPPVAAKKSKASVPTASGVKQKLAERRSELGPDSPAGSPSMIRPASSIKSRLADKRRSDLDHSIHGESARSIDQAAADAKAAQAVEVVGAK